MCLQCERAIERYERKKVEDKQREERLLREAEEKERREKEEAERLALEAERKKQKLQEEREEAKRRLAAREAAERIAASQKEKEEMKDDWRRGEAVPTPAPAGKYVPPSARRAAAGAASDSLPPSERKEFMFREKTDAGSAANRGNSMATTATGGGDLTPNTPDVSSSKNAEMNQPWRPRMRKREEENNTTAAAGTAPAGGAAADDVVDDPRFAGKFGNKTAAASGGARPVPSWKLFAAKHKKAKADEAGGEEAVDVVRSQE